MVTSSDRYSVKIQVASTVESDDNDNLKLEITCLDVLPVMSARRLRPCAIASIPLAVTPAMDCSASCVKSTEASGALPWSISHDHAMRTDSISCLIRISRISAIAVPLVRTLGREH